jgi:hypothetical protein
MALSSWPLTVREEHILSVFKNRLVRKISEPKREEVTGTRENSTVSSFMICTVLQILFK